VIDRDLNLLSIGAEMNVFVGVDLAAGQDYANEKEEANEQPFHACTLHGHSAVPIFDAMQHTSLKYPVHVTQDETRTPACALRKSTPAQGLPAPILFPM